MSVHVCGADNNNNFSSSEKIKMQNHTAKTAKKTFIERALEQILADKDISRSHHLQLKKACESALGTFVLIFQCISVLN